VASVCSGDGDAEREEATGRPEREEELAMDVVFPHEGWQRTDPEELGFEPEALDALAAEAQASGANCLLVIRHGRIAGEWYWNGADESSLHQIFSITKAYTSTLVGIAQDEGLLDIDDPASVYIPQWAGTPSADVTIRHLLSMTSGRRPVAPIDPQESGAYYGSPDLTTYAISRDQIHPPGSVWSLSETDVQPLEAVLESVTGVQPDQYAADKLFGPIGDTHTALAKDSVGNPILDVFAKARCQDVARLGLLYLNDGNWDGAEVVSSGWVAEATQPGQDIFSRYGLLWWLNRPGNTKIDQFDQASVGDMDPNRGRLPPEAPEDLYAATGAFGQILLVHPSTDTIVVRLGTAPDFLDRTSGNLAARVITEALVDD
jgi:CubicO group peptidase (beta-lactamase class C family)